MAYAGYLVKVGSYTVPLKYIKYETFQAVWSTTDFDSYRDANGTLHRDSVRPNKVLKVEWETPDLSGEEFEDLMSHIRAQYLTSDAVGGAPLFNGKAAKSCVVEAWMPEEGTYKQDTCYLTSDVNFTIRMAEEDKTYLNQPSKYPPNTPHVTTTPFTIRYDPVRFAFIGYSKPSAT